MITAEKMSELERNYAAFRAILPDLLPEREGQHALMRHGQIIEWFANVGDAMRAGRTRFADDLFSVQRARRTPVDFGWFSRAPFDSAI